MCNLYLYFVLISNAAIAVIMHNNGTVRHFSRAEFLEGLLIDYNNKVPPNYEIDRPCEVSIQLNVNNFDTVNEALMDFSLGLIINLKWRDERLGFYDIIKDNILELDIRMMEKVWVPDLYIANEKRSFFHEVTVPNKMMHLFKDGNVVYKSRVSITAYCPMELHRYPLDSQICSLFIKSFSYTMNNLKFKWDNEGVKIDSMITLPQFKIEHTTLSDCSTYQKDGNFTCLQVDFHLQRMLGFYILQLYVPSALIVLISWISFWLSCEAVPARTSLGILTVLTMTTQAGSAVSSLPKVSYIKAIDIWMAVCMAFVFFAMIEFAFVNVFIRRTMKYTSPDEINSEMTGMKQSKELDFIYYRDPKGKDKAETLDKASRVGFPLFYFLFCLIYWSVFSTLSNPHSTR